MRITTDENGGEQDVNEELNGEICDPQPANLSPSTGDYGYPAPPSRIGSYRENMSS